MGGVRVKAGFMGGGLRPGTGGVVHGGRFGGGGGKGEGGGSSSGGSSSRSSGIP